MPIVKFGNLAVNRKTAEQPYMDTLLVPVVSTAGPQTSIVYSSKELYSKFNPVNSEDGELIQRLLDLGYRVLVYRVNYVDEYSTVKIIDQDTYSYFKYGKDYQEGFGNLITNKGIGNKELIWKFNLGILSYINLDSIFGDSDCRVITFPAQSLIFRLFKGAKDPSYDTNKRYNIIKDYEYFEPLIDENTQRPKEIITPDGIKRCISTFDQLKSDLYQTALTELGLDPKYDEDGNLVIQFSSPNLIYSDIDGLLSTNPKSTYDHIYSNGLNLDGIEFKSKYEDSDSDISISIRQESDTEYVIGAERRRNGKVIYSEATYVNLDENSEFYLYEYLNKTSQIIEYVSGELKPEMVGTYTLGYPSPKDYDIYDPSNRFELETEYPILFVVGTLKWDSDTDTGKSASYALRLIRLATSLETVALISDPQTDSIRDAGYSLVITPNIKSSYQTLSAELLLKAVIENRMEADIDFSGRLDGTPSFNGKNVVTLEYDQYIFTFNQPNVYFQGQWIPLKLYCGWVAVDKYIKWYLDRNAIAKTTDIDQDDLRSGILNKYENLVSRVEFEGRRVDRKYELKVYLYFETQTPQKLILIVNLIEE